MKKNLLSAIPNALTMGNLIFGILALQSIFTGNFIAVYVIIAVVFDVLDGMVARLLNVGSPLGVELDSLADAVSFVVVPAMLVSSMVDAWYGVFVAAFIAVCGILRLGIFNLTKQKDAFLGMPTPMFAFFTLGWWLALDLPSLFTAIAFVLVSSLMVSRLKFPSFKSKGFNKLKLLALLVFLLFLSLFIIGVGVILSALLFHVVCWILLLYLYPKLDRKAYVLIFMIGFLALELASYRFIIFFAVLPLMYGILASPLIYLAGVRK